MSVHDYDTVEYQRERMINAAGMFVVCVLGLFLASWLEPDGFIRYVLAFGALVSGYGFFDHRRYMRKLKQTGRG